MLIVSKSPDRHIRFPEPQRKGARPRRHQIVILAALAVAGCESHASRLVNPFTPSERAAARTGFAPETLVDVERAMGQGAIGLTEAAQQPGDASERPPEGWASLDLASAPDLGLGSLSFEDAQRLNGFLPANAKGQPAAAPFVLKASAAEKARALLCLTQAVYYEAALEPPDGQAAVAQTVINRVRNPNFPKSVCGVVYQGSSQVTGCQFSFTCDGSRQRTPIEPFWSRAKAVAERALNGSVMPDVGLSTHYHADYVLPRWSPTLVKIGQFGSQIFYRFPGPPGQPDAFRERYRGGELKVSLAGPPPEAVLAWRQSNGLLPPQAPGTETFTVSVIDPRTGTITSRAVGGGKSHRGDPTPEEVSRINSVLAQMAAAKSE